MAGKRKRKPIDPETRARWAAARRQLATLIERHDRAEQRRLEVEARRRARLRRWTFGLLGREEPVSG